MLACTPLGEELRALAPAIVSRRAGRGYLGYLRGQRERLLGSRRQKRVNRPGARRGARLRHEVRDARRAPRAPGLELLETGRLTLPMPEPQRSQVMAIRTGERAFEDAVAAIEELERRLEVALERTVLPARPDYDAVNAFLADAYRRS